MFGLVVFLATGVYLLISIAVVRWAIRHARTTGRSAKRWGWGAALVMYLIPFWDWLPTVAAHRYYCATESGFWVYKTLEQWKAENPGVMEGLVAYKPSIRREGTEDNHSDGVLLNTRFRWVTDKRHVVHLLPLYRWKHELVDIRNGNVLARFVDFSSGAGHDDLKFWVNIESCRRDYVDSVGFSIFVNTFKGATR